MQTVKILHCGDLHFDTPFSELSGSEAEKRKEDLRETFGEIVRLAKEEKVDMLLVSGDLFDNLSVMKTTIDYILKKLGEIPGIKVFIAPGNHDPYFEKSYYKMIHWPENVHIFNDSLNRIQLQDKNVCVYGIGFSKAHVRESLLENFTVEDYSSINIMVLHGDVVGSSQTSDYNPITEEQITDSMLDYLALGHRHACSGIKRSGKTYWAYSGNPEGRGFDELGAKGVIIGEVGKGYVNLSFREICKRKYIIQTVDISGVSTYEDIVLKVNEALGLHDLKNRVSALMTEKDKNLYKIILTGELSEDFSVNVRVLEEKLGIEFHFVKIKDNTTIKIDFETLSRELSLKGIFIKKMLDKINKTEDITEKKRLEAALKLGILSLDERQVTVE